MLKLTKTLLREYNIRPKKRLGQHFLVSKKYIDTLISLLNPMSNDIVIEIGAGLGIITKILATYVKKVVAVEVDTKLCEIISNMCKDMNVDVINTNIIKFDFCKYKTAKVIGNLPYYITAPIVAKLIKNNISYSVITVQREVAERIVANCNSKEYGALSVFVQFYTTVNKISNIKKICFFPVPEVDSAVISMRMRDKTADVNEDMLFKVVRAAFSQRRKIIKNSLESIVNRDKLGYLCKGIGVSTNARAEELSVSDFVNLTKKIYEV